MSGFPTRPGGGTDWEECYRTGQTPWDKGAVSPGLVEALGFVRMSGRVLVPGCGLGHDARKLAASAGVEGVVGLDVSPSAVKRASELAVSGMERYVCGDLFHLPGELEGGFDWVWEHTCFCAIDPGMRGAYVEAVAVSLRPRGRFLGVFYLDPGRAAGEAGPPFGVATAELDVWFGKRFRILEEWDPREAYPGREGRERMRLMERLD